MKNKITRLLTMIILMTASASIKAQPGSLDPTWGSSGFVITNVGKNNCFAQGVAVQPDGKTIICGKAFMNPSKTSGVLIRYNTDGTLDNSFGDGGVVTASFTKQFDSFSSIALQADGRIVVTGLSIRNDSDFALLARFSPGGNLDKNFRNSTNGLNYCGIGTVGVKVLVQPDQKILLLVNNNEPVTYTSQSQFFRYTSTGAPDNTFGVNGNFTYTANQWLYSMALTESGKIISTGGDGLTVAIRLTSHGTLDNKFGTNGVVTLALSTYDAPKCIIAQSGGKILIGGGLQSTNFIDELFSVTRLNKDGSLDLSFNGTGFNGVKVQSSDVVWALNMQSNGKVIATGSASGAGKAYVTLVRYDLSTGTIDPTWGNNGIDTVNITFNNINLTYAVAAAITPDNQKIVVTGQASGGLVTNNFATERFNLHASSIARTEIRPTSSLNALLYPNPTANSSQVSFSLASDDLVTVSLFNTAGQLLKVLSSENQSAGNHSLPIEMNNLSAGNYFVQIKTPSAREILKVTKE